MNHFREEPALAAQAMRPRVDGGKLSWNDPAAKWLPELTSPGGRATLLSHTDGYLDVSIRKTYLMQACNAWECMGTRA